MASRVALAAAHVTGRTGTTAVTLEAADATNFNYFENTGKEVVLIQNDDVAQQTVTFATPGTLDGSALPDLTITVAAGALAVVGPFPRSLYNTDYTDDEEPPATHEDVVLVNASDADVKLAVIRVGA